MNNNSSHQNGSPETHAESEIRHPESSIENPPSCDSSSIQHPESSIVPPAPADPEKPSTFNVQPSIPPSVRRHPPSTIHHQLTTNRRKGHIARLPKTIRERINQMLDDGISYPKIVKSLGDDAKGITERCVRSWKKGGYQDYLRYQQMLDQCRARQFRVAPLLNRRHNINTFQATQQVASAQICETIVELGADILRQAVAENPMNYFRMLNAFSRLANGGLRCERHLLDEVVFKEEHRRPAKNIKGGMTTEQMKEFRELLNDL